MEKSTTIDKHISLRLTRFFMTCIGMWYPKNYRDKIISNLIIIYIICAGIFSLLVMSIDFYHTKGDLRVVVFNIPCLLSVIQELFKMIRFAIKITEVHSLNSFTVKTFWKKNYDASESCILENCNKISFLFCGTFLLFITAIDVHHVTLPIIEYEKNKTRKLPFKLYFGFNERSPWYEVFYILEIGCVFGVTVVTTAFILHFFTMSVYAAGQFQILQRKISLICHQTYEVIEEQSTMYQSKLYQNLKDCIKKHQMLIKYIARLSNLYSPITAVYALGAVGSICTTGFQLVTGVNNNFHRTALSIEFFLATIIMLFMACYCCQKIINESSAVFQAAYSLPNDEKAYNQALFFMIMRSQTPCTIQCFSAPMSIEIFTAVMNKSMSFFAVLRQMLENND